MCETRSSSWSARGSGVSCFRAVKQLSARILASICVLRIQRWMLTGWLADAAYLPPVQLAHHKSGRIKLVKPTADRQASVSASSSRCSSLVVVVVLVPRWGAARWGSDSGGCGGANSRRFNLNDWPNLQNLVEPFCMMIHWRPTHNYFSVFILHTICRLAVLQLLLDFTHYSKRLT